MLKWLIPILMVLMIPAVYGIAIYGDWNYGAGHYGINTPPNVDAFAPTGLTPQYNYTTGQIFNVTFSDDDGDTVSIEWYVNGTTNTTNNNLSYVFNNLGLFNVTSQLNDTYDQTITVWIVTVINDTAIFVPVINDTLIAPIIVPIGNLIAIKTNLTSPDNVTDVRAILDLGSNDFNFLSDTPPNQSIGNLYSNNITPVTWFISTPINPKSYILNITYTTDSNTYQGKDQNLIVVSPINKMEIAIAFIIMMAAIIFFVLSFLTNPIKHPAIKLFFLILGLVIVLMGLNFAYISSVDNGASTAVQTLLESLYKVGIYSFTIFMFYVVIYHVLWPVFMHFKQYRA